jgi:hypothetical protein
MLILLMLVVEEGKEKLGKMIIFSYLFKLCGNGKNFFIHVA